MVNTALHDNDCIYLVERILNGIDNPLKKAVSVFKMMFTALLLHLVVGVFFLVYLFLIETIREILLLYSVGRGCKMPGKDEV